MHVGRTYYVVASGACDEAGEGSVGGRACIRAGTQYLHIIPYDVPMNACLAVEGSSGTVELQWEQPAELFCPIDHYAIFRSEADTIQISQLGLADLVRGEIDSATFQWRVENAPRGINFWYAVVAYDPTGEAVGISKNVQPSYSRTGFNLTSPADGMRIISDTPTFSWAGGEPPFTLRLSDSPTFTIYHEFSSILGQSYTPPISLDDKKLWYWKVIDSRYVVSDESAWSFRTNLHPLPPAQVQLLGPISNEKVMSYRPSFSWLPSGTHADSIVYHLLIGKDPNLNNLILDAHTTSPLFNVVDSLADDQIYYWKVEATGEGGTSPWSTVEAFHLDVPDAPSPVKLIYPSWSQSMSGGPEAPFESGLYPTFRWSSAIDPDAGDEITYTLWYATDASFSDKVEVTVLADTQYTPVVALAEDKIYYWKVFAVDQTGRSTGTMGKPYGFVTNSENRQPTVSDLVDPIRGALLNYRDVLLRWSSVEDDQFDLKLYTLHVSTQRSMADTVGIFRRMLQIDCLLQNLADRVYYWQVTVNSVTCAGLDGGTSHSRVDSFEVYNGLVTQVISPVANEILEIGSVKQYDGQWPALIVSPSITPRTAGRTGDRSGPLVPLCRELLIGLFPTRPLRTASFGFPTGVVHGSGPNRTADLPSGPGYPC